MQITADSRGDRDWAAVPKAALAHALSHQITPELLQSAALVCKTWAEAHVQAVITARSELSLDLCSDISSFEGFLHEHGKSLKQLHVCSFAGRQEQRYKTLQQLPCPQLQDLLLCKGGLSADLGALTELTSLDLKQIMVLGLEWWEPGAASPIATITGLGKLQHLSLHAVILPPPPRSPDTDADAESDADAAQPGGKDQLDDADSDPMPDWDWDEENNYNSGEHCAWVPWGFLQHLPDLSHLSLDLVPHSLQGLAYATKLQHLQLSWVRGTIAVVVEALPQLVAAGSDPDVWFWLPSACTAGFPAVG